LHKKGKQEEVQKKKTRKTKKLQRAIVGTTLEDINAKRNQKPEVRQANREAALRLFNLIFFVELQTKLDSDYCIIILFLFFILYLLSIFLYLFFSSFCSIILKNREIKEKNKAKKLEKAAKKEAASKATTTKPAKSAAPKVSKATKAKKEASKAKAKSAAPKPSAKAR
jgi:hypothetical protein